MYCSLCPRQCNADRTMAQGWCHGDERIHVSSIVLHKGEEPPISGKRGIVNIFFPSCNMRCVYCQNYQISERGTGGTVMTLNEVCDAIEELLPLSEGNLGFVSPTHYIMQMKLIISEIRRRGHNPAVVYNTNGYDLPVTIRSLEGYIDVWLPDYKYSDDTLAEELSGAPGYSAFALPSLKEMVHQCGVTLQVNERGIAQRGVIVRHLVLPGAVSNSIGVLRTIAEEISPNIHISLMSQYYPPEGNPRLQEYEQSKGTDRSHNPVQRTVTRSEYETVISAFHSFGFRKGWTQEYDSNGYYRPDFFRDDPFN